MADCGPTVPQLPGEGVEELIPQWGNFQTDSCRVKRTVPVGKPGGTVGREPRGTQPGTGLWKWVQVAGDKRGLRPQMTELPNFWNLASSSDGLECWPRMNSALSTTSLEQKWTHVHLPWAGYTGLIFNHLGFLHFVRPDSAIFIDTADFEMKVPDFLMCC